VSKNDAAKFKISILGDLLEMQKKFQNQHFPLQNIEISSFASAIASEAMEIWSMTGKWWYEQKYSLEKIKEESIDIFHFLLGLWLKLDMDESEIIKLYKDKMKVNIERQIQRKK
jgi:dimeric dUTPase (all-alpha-NTP-PPase superfamily)